MERACKAPFTQACSMTRRCLPILLGAVTVVVIVACSQPLEVTLFNSTNGPITVHATTGHGFLTRKKDILIGSFMLARFDYPNAVLRMSAAGCELTYTTAQTLQGYPFSHDAYNAPRAHLEPDLAIDLLPPGNCFGCQPFRVLRPSSRSCPNPEPKT